jgi:hypothetical protein
VVCGRGAVRPAVVVRRRSAHDHNFFGVSERPLKLRATSLTGRYRAQSEHSQVQTKEFHLDLVVPLFLLPPTYWHSSANMMVMMRSATDASDGSGE